MAASAAFFPNASGSNFHGLQFNVIQNTQPVAIDPALKILHRYRALEATHTSKSAAGAVKCKPGTRVKAIKDITSWADDVPNVPIDPSSPVESVLWFRGPAGAGKTCIMREVTRACHKKGTLIGDYFFSTRVPGLDDEAPFVATIVSHLITVIPALHHPVRETIRLNPDIFEQSLEFQVEKLISDHATSIPPQAPASRVRILIIDGFDECRDPIQRAHLLQLIHSLVTPPHSFRVVMASRPELDIRTAFDRPPLKSITKILHLESYEASLEIYQHLSDEFTRIRETHPAKQSIPAEWPGQPTLHVLTDKSSGGYIYPSVVIKYVDNPRRHPVELLRHVLDASLTASSRRPFAELDALYQVILNPPDIDIPLMKRLLHVAIEVTRFPRWVPPLVASKSSAPLAEQILSAPCLDKFLSLENGTTEMTLCDLHSVLSVTEDVGRPWIYFHHKSLEDYLCSPERAGNLYQPQAETHSDLLAVCFHQLELWNWKLVGPTAHFQNVNIDITLTYPCAAWEHLLIEKKCFPPSVLDFDARIVWRCLAFARWTPPGAHEFSNFATSFHNVMCKERPECWRSCTSFRRMLEYHGKLWDFPGQHRSRSSSMERLKAFEGEFQGLFAPLDLSPSTGGVTTTSRDDAPVHLPPPELRWSAAAAGVSSLNLPQRPRD